MPALTIPQRRGAIYVRVSTDRQESDGTSLDSQEASCRAYCDRNGLTVVDVYREATSGGTMDRPQLWRVRDAVRAGAVTDVVFDKVDRLLRSGISDAFVFVDEIQQKGATAHCVLEPLGKGVMGDVMLAVRAAMAQQEKDDIKFRTMRGKRTRVESGKVHSHGSELYGFRRDKAAGVRAIYAPEAATVRAVFQWVATEGIGLREVARRLNADGTPPPSAGKMTYDDPERVPAWGKGQLVRMLRNPSYAGQEVAYRWTVGGKARPVDEWVHLPAGVTPAIVDMPTWDAAQARLDTNKGEASRNEARPYLLRGLMTCPVCGKPLRCENRARQAEFIAVRRARRLQGLVARPECRLTTWKRGYGSSSPMPAATPRDCCGSGRKSARPGLIRTSPPRWNPPGTH